MVSYREAVDLSPAQRAVLFDDAPEVLVSAGAGSGKTKLLVSYFVHALLDEGIALDRLAAVTFTRKAGSELAERIRKELVACGRTDLARSIDGAAIGTIHGLCRRLLADESLKAGVDPAFGVLEADTEKLVKQEVFRQAWARVVASAGEDDLRVFAGRKESGLRESVLALYGRLRSMGHDRPQVRIEPGPSEAEARATLLAACEEALEAGRGLPKRGISLENDLRTIVECVQWVERGAAGAGGEPAVADTLRFFPTYKTGSAEPFLVPMREALSRYRVALAEVELRPVLALTNKLLAAFHDEYSAYKESRGVLDFTDLELGARAVLAGLGGAGAGRPLALSRLLVDEFQDTNELQCSILEGLGAERLLMVGDARQSIYRFRGADVEVFRRREEAVGLSQHRLDTNYRSAPEILGFINRLFSRHEFFGSERFNQLVPGRGDAPGASGRAAQPAAAPAQAGAAAGDHGAAGGGPSAATEIIVVERVVSSGEEPLTLDRQQAEAYAVAAHVRRLIDEEGWARRDIVVLLPALSNVTRYQEALAARKVDVYVVGGKGYYSQDEVEDVAALLRLLVNPHDDLSLLTVLRSPMVGVSDDCLFLIGRARGRKTRSLWTVLRDGGAAAAGQDDRARLQAFVVHVDTMRHRVGRPGLSRFIDDAVSACGYDACLLATPEGRRRFANLRKLMRMAADYEALEGPDLAGFVALIGSLGDLGDDEGNAPSLAEEDNVVRVMSVHQAKGLEFPVVVLAGLCSDAWDPGPGDFVIAPDGRMAALAKGAERHKSETCVPYWGPAPQIIADDQARQAEEDVRLLYVAMTRARDKLVLVGSRKADKDKADDFRIGRIVTSLGLSQPPRPGEVVLLPDAYAVVIGVSVEEEAATGAAAATGAVEAADTAEGAFPDPAAAPVAAAAPCFLELRGPGVAPQRVSFSSLAAFRRCPRQFYLERVLGLGAAVAEGRAAAAPELPAGRSDVHEAGDGGGALGRLDLLLDRDEHRGGRDIGILVHALLESADLTGGRPAPEPLRQRAAESAAERSLALSGEAIARAAELVAAFWDSPAVDLPGLRQAQREAPFSFVQGGVTVQGVMDILCRAAGVWSIVDYKTNVLGGRAPAEVAGAYDLQATMYCLAALRAGAPAVRMQFLFLERPSEPVEFEYGPGDRAGLEAQLSAALAELGEGRFPACIGAACRDCSVEDLCSAMNTRAVVVE